LGSQVRLIDNQELQWYEVECTEIQHRATCRNL
jgi:hypothetical protein